MSKLSEKLVVLTLLQKLLDVDSRPSELQFCWPSSRAAWQWGPPCFQTCLQLRISPCPAIVSTLTGFVSRLRPCPLQFSTSLGTSSASSPSSDRRAQESSSSPASSGQPLLLQLSHRPNWQHTTKLHTSLDNIVKSRRECSNKAFCMYICSIST